MVIDRKFKILAVNPCKKGSIYTEEDGFFFKATDIFAVVALQAYISAMKGRKKDGFKIQAEQIESAELLLDRVKHLQITHDVTIPDIDEGCEMDVCLKPNEY